MNVDTVIQDILDGKTGYHQFDGSYGRTISNRLLEHGFVGRHTLSYCKKANYEIHLIRKSDDLKVDIVVACLFGLFTEIRVFR